MRCLANAMMIAGAVALAAALGAGFATAQDKAALIKQRQALMKQQAAGLKSIQDFVVGEIDRNTALAKIDELLTLPPQIVALFPPGTSVVDFPGQTHAKPEIWTQWDRFKDIPVALRAAEEKLATAIRRGSKQDVLDQLDGVGRGGCGACHSAFRAPLQP